MPQHNKNQNLNRDRRGYLKLRILTAVTIYLTHRDTVVPNTPSRRLRFSNTVCIFIRLFLNAFVLSFFSISFFHYLPFRSLLFYFIYFPPPFPSLTPYFRPFSLFCPFFTLYIFIYLYIHTTTFILPVVINLTFFSLPFSLHSLRLHIHTWLIYTSGLSSILYTALVCDWCEPHTFYYPCSNV